MLHEGILIFPRIIFIKYFCLALYYLLSHLLFQLIPLNYALLIWSAFLDQFSIVLFYPLLWECLYRQFQNRWLLGKTHRVIPHVVTIATGHKYWISFEMHIFMARYNRFTAWQYKYSSLLLMVSSSPSILIMHRLGEYPIWIQCCFNRLWSNFRDECK